MLHFFRIDDLEYGPPVKQLSYRQLSQLSACFDVTNTPCAWKSNGFVQNPLIFWLINWELFHDYHNLPAVIKDVAKQSKFFYAVLDLEALPKLTSSYRTNLKKQLFIYYLSFYFFGTIFWYFDLEFVKYYLIITIKQQIMKHTTKLNLVGSWFWEFGQNIWFS